MRVRPDEHPQSVPDRYPARCMDLLFNGKAKFAPGVKVDMASTFTYFGGELLESFLGAVVTWLATSTRPH